jgi:hypothetical protein
LWLEGFFPICIGLLACTGALFFIGFSMDGLGAGTGCKGMDWNGMGQDGMGACLCLLLNHEDYGFGWLKREL